MRWSLHDAIAAASPLTRVRSTLRCLLHEGDAREPGRDFGGHCRISSADGWYNHSWYNNGDAAGREGRKVRAR